MPRNKQLSLFGTEVDISVPRKKPTLAQYLKEVPTDDKDIESTVRIIWLPGEWKNYTLETDLFRVSIRQEHQFYSLLESQIDEFTKGNQTFRVVVTKRKPISLRLDIDSELTGEWFFIGESIGLKFTADSEDDDTEF